MVALNMILKLLERVLWSLVHCRLSNMLRAVLTLHACVPTHPGIVNLKVVNRIGRLLHHQLDIVF